ncbi:Ff.00g078250.m01.CDS01 [Fusarium sp. VM40]|nr:Ff.00g078250.m01.CDS01 [Fusarium sp. VM40]
MNATLNSPSPSGQPRPTPEVPEFMANELCVKRNMEPLDFTVAQSWDEVEQSVSQACKTLERLSSKDKTLSPGFTNKLKGRFRSLCTNAGAGTTLTNLVPTDSYCSVLCGGLRIIFKALEETGKYREEVYNALEEIPFILDDNSALLDLYHDDGELHQRVASLYRAIYQLMEVIVDWFLKTSRVIGTKLLFNPTGFSGKLKDCLAHVKNTKQRFTASIAAISANQLKLLEQQNYSIMNSQIQDSKQIMMVLEQSRNTHLLVLDTLVQFLDSGSKAGQAYVYSPVHEDTVPQILAPELDIDTLLDQYLYDAQLVHRDCQSIFRSRYAPGYDLDEDLVSTVKSNPRFLSWLTLDESSLLFLDTRSDNQTCSLEMPIVTAEIFRDILTFSSKQVSANKEASTAFICLAFFCSQHKDYARDLNAQPTELVMSILLQLLDQYHYFEPQDLANIFSDFDPSDLDSTPSSFEALVTELPSHVFLVTLVDDISCFTWPVVRRRGMEYIMERLSCIHRERRYKATFKLLFGNSAQNNYANKLFMEDETLRLWTPDGSGVASSLQFLPE